MPRPRLTQDAVERDLSLLWEYESEGVTQVALAEREGQCRQRISQRLDRARRIRAEREREYRRDQASQPQVGDSIPYAALTDDPSYERGHYYDLRTDDLSLDSGLVRIGDYDGRHLRVRKVTEGEKREGDGPTSYKPTPGLKGGVG